MNGESDGEANDRGDEPAEVLVEQREEAPGEIDRCVEVQRGADGGGQRFHKIEDGGGPREDHDGDIDGPVVVEALADESQHDQRSGGRVDQHEHGDGIFDDGAQTDVGDGKREECEEDGPELVGDFAVGHFDERLRAGRDQADGGLKAGKGDGDGKDDLTDAAKIMARDLREGDAAVFRDLKQAARLRAHDDGEDVDDSHEDTGQDAGAEDIRRDGIVLLHAHAADDVDDHNPESEARDGVHGAVALDE